MADALRIALFCEDRAQQAFLEPMVRRLADRRPEIRTVWARGGQPHALRELDTFQRNEEAVADTDLVIVATDGNCATFTRKRKEIRKRADRIPPDRLVTATPDPHIERWYLADPACVKRVIGAGATLPEAKCERSVYKKTLGDTIRRAGHGGSVDGIAFARELATGMDLHQAGRHDHSLKNFVDELHAWFRRRSAGDDRA